jgi:hypothetical protein
MTLLRNVPPSTDKKYPTFIVMTASSLWDCQKDARRRINKGGDTHNMYPTPARIVSRTPRSKLSLMLESLLWGVCACLHLSMSSGGWTKMSACLRECTFSIMAGERHLKTNRARQMIGRMTRKMQMPTYWPAVFGVQN